MSIQTLEYTRNDSINCIHCNKLNGPNDEFVVMCPYGNCGTYYCSHCFRSQQVGFGRVVSPWGCPCDPKTQFWGNRGHGTPAEQPKYPLVKTRKKWKK